MPLREQTQCFKTRQDGDSTRNPVSTKHLYNIYVVLDQPFVFTSHTLSVYIIYIDCSVKPKASRPICLLVI